MRTRDGRTRFLTSWLVLDGDRLVKRGGEVAAASWAEAEIIAAARVPAESVDGVLYNEIDG